LAEVKSYFRDDHPSQTLSIVLKKLNVIQQMQSCIKTKDTTTQNEHNLRARIVMPVSTFPWLVIDLIMVALRDRADHYIFAL